MRLRESFYKQDFVTPACRKPGPSGVDDEVTGFPLTAAGMTFCQVDLPAGVSLSPLVLKTLLLLLFLSLPVLAEIMHICVSDQNGKLAVCKEDGGLLDASDPANRKIIEKMIKEYEAKMDVQGSSQTIRDNGGNKPLDPGLRPPG